MKIIAYHIGISLWRIPPKLLLIMRLTTLILIVALAQVSAKGFGQKITLNANRMPIEKVLQAIGEQSGYEIFYKEQDVKGQYVTLKLTNASVEDAIKELVSGMALNYKIVKNNIVLSRKEPTFLERLADRWAAIDVVGRVVDAQNRPLPGASVRVKKTGRAVSTDGNGYFFLKNVEEGTVLVISFIGYVSREVAASKEMGSLILDVSLSKLDEVQVIAYGKTTQRLSTGNVTTIKADVIEKQPVNNPLLALQGRVPGLFIEQATGFAGTGVKVRIQGQNSLNNGSDPLYVIDGLPYSSQLLLDRAKRDIPNIQGTSGSDAIGNPLSFINPADIESIDILKDADATAIYGSRAANGAILITTKKGKSGDTRVNLNIQSGWGMVAHKLDLMNSQQYMEMRREALRNDGVNDFIPGPYGDSDLNGNWDNTRYTDWQKELIGGTAGYQDLNASVSGGSDRTTFLVGAGHHRETTVFPKKYSDNKSSFRFNVNNISVSQKFKVQFSGSYLFDSNRLPNFDLTDVAIRMIPVAPSLYNSEGGINWAPDDSGNSTFTTNPIGPLLQGSSLNKTSNLIANLMLSYKVLPGMELKSGFGYSKLASDIVTKRFLQGIPPEFLSYNIRQSNFVKNDNTSWSIEPQLTYVRNISLGKLDVLFGATFFDNRSFGTGINAIGFSNDLVLDDILSATTIIGNSSTSSVYKYSAVFGRINYNWDNKYVLNLTARRDGSSRFGPASQFHNFAAIGGAWIFSNETLVKNHLPLLSFGKIRASYGKTGSDQIPNYQFLSLYDPLQQNIPYQGIIGYQPNRLTNPKLEWEETTKLQIGADLGFLEDKILFSANYYKNKSSNQLLGYNLPSTTGFGNILKNRDAEIENFGWEFSASTTNIAAKKITWSSSINLTIPKTLLNASSDNRFSSVEIVGQPLSAQYVYHFLGVDPATGIYQFQDKNGNPTSVPSDPLDKIILIDLAPKFYGGIQNSLSYKGLQLDILFSFVKQIAKNARFGLGAPAGFNARGYGNQPISLLSRWQKPGDIAAIQRFTSGYQLDGYLNTANNSDAAWADASYVRLKNVAISWQLPKLWVKSVQLQDVSLFVQGQNLWTLTNYSGLDPETKNLEMLPPLRVITIGIKANL